MGYTEKDFFELLCSKNISLVQRNKNVLLLSFSKN
jgi:hypothetical protein